MLIGILSTLVSGRRGGVSVGSVSLSSLVIPSAGTTVVGTCSTSLDTDSVPSAGDFAIFGTTRTISSVAVSGSTFTLTLSGSIGTNEVISLSYTSGSNPIKSATGAFLSNFTLSSVTNNSTQATLQIARSGTSQTSTFSGPSTGTSQTFTIALPSTYDSSDSGTTYPVVFWLHGKNGSPNTMVTNFVAQFQTAEAAGTVAKCIHIAPTYGSISFWSNAKDGSNPAGDMLNELYTYIQSHLRCTTDFSQWHLAGFSMGGFGVARWYGLDPSKWGSICVMGGANLDATTGNGWATGDSDAYSAVFGNDSTYLAANSPVQIWTTYASTIISKDDPIRTALGDGDTAVPQSMAAFRSALNSLNIRHTEETLVSTTHSAASYATGDTDGIARWISASMYDPTTDDLVLYLDSRNASSYTVNGSNQVTSITNIKSSTSYTENTNPPSYSSTGLNGYPCWSGDGTSTRIYGTEAAVTNELSGDDQPMSILFVGDAVSPDNIATIIGFENTLGNAAWILGTNTTGNGRWRMTKIDDLAGSSTAANSSDITSGSPQLVCYVVPGTTATGYVNRGSANPNAGAFDRTTTTIGRLSLFARVRNVVPTVDEFSSAKIGLVMLWGRALSDVERIRRQDWANQRFFLVN